LQFSTAILEKPESGICTQKLVGSGLTILWGIKYKKIAANRTTIPFPVTDNSNNLFPPGFVSHTIKLISQLSV
jgi:hypothetical protein